MRLTAAPIPDLDRHPRGPMIRSMTRATRCIALSLLATAGCHRPTSTISPPLVPVAAYCEAGYVRLWTAATDVLRQHGFKLDLTDAVTGHITTQPVGSQHFFEFWRDDVATPFDAWEATLANVRRSATVDINRAAHTEGCRIVVSVHKQRFSTPERQVTNSAAANHFLGTALPAFTSGRRIAQTDSHWIDLGRDPAMEDRIRNQILESATHSNPPPIQSRARKEAAPPRAREEADPLPGPPGSAAVPRP